VVQTEQLRYIHKEAADNLRIEIGGARLRFRKKGDTDSRTNQLHSQFQFCQRGLAHAGIVVREAVNETPEPKLAQLIVAVAMQCVPLIVKITGEPFLFAFPGRSLFKVSVSQMCNQPDGLFWTKASHSYATAESPSSFSDWPMASGFRLAISSYMSSSQRPAQPSTSRTSGSGWPVRLMVH